MIHAGGRPERWLATVASLLRARPGIDVLIGARQPVSVGPLTALGATPVAASSVVDLAEQAWSERGCHLLVVTGPTVFPAGALDPALSAMTGDRRVATVSFLGEGTHPFPGLDADTVTGRIRGRNPSLVPVTTAFASGPATLVSAYALSAVGPPVDADGMGPHAALADFSARARRRSFVDLIDPSTWCEGEDARELDPGVRHWLVTRHPFLAGLDAEEAHPAIRPRVRGLRVLVDASWHGGWEMGTQVQAVALIRALARRDDVERVSVALGSETARAALGHPKIDVRVSFGTVEGLGPVDVVHRPFQPDGPLDLESWRRVGARTVLTLLDLIAYHNGSYFPSPDAWGAHRRNLRDIVGRVDGVTVISADVARAIALEQLPVESSRVFVVGLGTDHLRGDEAQRPPADLHRFVLVLGADYAHKNRDLAVRAVRELRRRGHDLTLVMAGATISTASEAPEEGVEVLGHVTAEERNWLLRHAAVVLYPSSAEGFGLVPYEAARFGTPTVLVPVGPLADLAGHLPVVAADWSQRALADATEALLTQPPLAAQQVEAMLGAGAALTWDGAASSLVGVYHRLLARLPVATA